MTLPLIQSTQQVLETAYFSANGDRSQEDGPIAPEDLCRRIDLYHNSLGDSLLTFLLNELVFDLDDGHTSETDYVHVVRFRLETIMREVSAVYHAVLGHLPETDE